MAKNKLFIIIGALLLIIGFIALFPLDVLMNDDVPGKIIFSFSGILLGLLLLLYGLFKAEFLKSIAIILAGVFLSILFWYVFLGGEWGDTIVISWVGVPSGLISGVLFLIINKYILSKSNKNSMPAKGLLFVVLLAITNFIFYKGGDLFY